MPLDPAPRAGVSSRSLPSGNLKPIAPLPVVPSLAVIVMNKSLALTVTLLIAGEIVSTAATSFTEDFSGTTINSNLAAPSEFIFGPNSSPIGTAQNPSGTRRYITTVATDFNTVDFVFEVTYTVGTPTAAQTPFIGFGSGAEDSNFFFEPHTSIYLRQFPDDFESGQLRLTISSAAQIPPQNPPEYALSDTPGPGNGTHRARITKTGNIVTLSEDEDYTGGVFTPDYATSRNITTDLAFLNNTNSRLFFGVQSGNTTFDSLTVSVVPEPSSMLLVVGGIALYSRRRSLRTNRRNG